MTITLYALSNDRARICHKRMSTNCTDTADMVRAQWEAEGWIVTQETDQ